MSAAAVTQKGNHQRPPQTCLRPASCAVAGLMLSDACDPMHCDDIKAPLATALCTQLGTSCELCLANGLLTISSAHCQVCRELGQLFSDRQLPTLMGLNLGSSGLDDEGMRLLATGLGRTVLPLKTLYLDFNRVGDRGAAALAEALGSGTPSLEHLCLASNEIGSTGVAALAKTLRQLPLLKRVHCV